MKILVVDDERYVLSDLVEQIGKALPGNEIREFNDPDAALEQIKAEGYKPHLCFLDIEMYGTSGIVLAKKIKDFSPLANIIFVTGHDKYAVEAFKVKASGYLLKPVSAEDITRELEELRHPVRRAGKEIYVQTFGSFEVYVHGEKVNWHRSRVKELFAFLIDREGDAEIKEIKSVLFEDDLASLGLDGYVQVIITELKKTLDAYGVKDVLLRSRGKLGLDRQYIDCDYWGFLDGDVQAIDSYRGVYMEDYVWAILTENKLCRGMN